MHAYRTLIAFIFCAAGATAAAGAVVLPQQLIPAAPFPAVLFESPSVTFVAPGVYEGSYDLQTAEGPISVHVVAADLRKPGVRAGVVLSDNALTSHGETVGDMAKANDAVAGVNGDYFDIGKTWQPLNLLVQNGVLVRTPGNRYAVAIGPNGVQYAQFSFTGSVQVGTRTAPLTGVNELPPPNGAVSIITPAYGPVPPLTNVTLVALTPLDGVPPFARYRADAIANNAAWQPPGYYLAIGVNSYGTAGVPSAGDVIVPTGDLSPIPLAQIAAAVGGGPMILHDGQWFDDPNGTAGAPTNQRIPATAVASAPDGTLFLIEVDGRQSTESVGVTRPQLVAIMQALGATEGMALDGGGSSTLVAREPGDADASLRNSPSDGHQRRVTEGLLVYSDAPHGPAARIDVAPEALRAVPGAAIPLHIAVTDAAGHPAKASAPLKTSIVPERLGKLVGGSFVAKHPGNGYLRVAGPGLHADVPISVVARPAALIVLPEQVNLLDGDRVQLRLEGADAHGLPVALPAPVKWTATRGKISTTGTYVAGAADATIRARVGKLTATVRARVGQHEVPMPFPTLVPIAYDFSTGKRAFYARLNATLPDGSIGVAFDVQGDGSGVQVHLEASNAALETIYLIPQTVNFTSWRHVVVRFPQTFLQPRILKAIYIMRPSGVPAGAAGSIVLRNLSALLPGSASP